MPYQFQLWKASLDARMKHQKHKQWEKIFSLMQDSVAILQKSIFF